LKRRDFITLLGGAAAAWPLAARAKQAERMRRIGVLMGYPEGDPQAQANVTALLQGLQNLGWIEGRNVQIDYRWAGGDPDKAQTFARELIAIMPDVMVPSTNQVTRILQQETRTISIWHVPVGTSPALPILRIRLGANGLSYSQRLRPAPNESDSSSIPTLLPMWVSSTRPKQLPRHSE